MKAPVIPPYTSREVMELLEKARALGVVTMKLPGFEASWELTPPTVSKPPPQQHRHPALEAAARHGESGESFGTCEKHAEALIEGNWGKPYCRSCHLDRKEKRWQQSQKRW